MCLLWAPRWPRAAKCSVWPSHCNTWEFVLFSSFLLFSLFLVAKFSFSFCISYPSPSVFLLFVSPPESGRWKEDPQCGAGKTFHISPQLCSPRYPSNSFPSLQQLIPTLPALAGLSINDRKAAHDELTGLCRHVYEQQTVEVNTAKPAFIHRTYHWFFSN